MIWRRRGKRAPVKKASARSRRTMPPARIERWQGLQPEPQPALPPAPLGLASMPKLSGRLTPWTRWAAFKDAPAVPDAKRKEIGTVRGHADQGRGGGDLDASRQNAQVKVDGRPVGVTPIDTSAAPAPRQGMRSRCRPHRPPQAVARVQVEVAAASVARSSWSLERSRFWSRSRKTTRLRQPTRRRSGPAVPTRLVRGCR